jgi:drug/metabolite transporter (DMT)-like permease
MRQGVALSLLSAVGFCGMALLIRLAASFDTFMVAQFRFVIGLALLGTAALSGWIRLDFRNGRLLFLRGLTGGAAVVLFFTSVAKLGVGKGTVISYAYPVFASLFGAAFLKERLGPARWLAVTGALAGIWLLSGPGTGPGTVSAASWAIGRYELLALAGSVLSGIAVVLVRKLHETDSTYAIFFAQCLVGLWLVIVPANVSGQALGYRGGLLLMAIGVIAAVSQLLMTEGYRHLSVTTASLLGMLTPVLSFLAGIVLFSEPVSLRGAVGALVVVACCALVILTDRPAAVRGR